jgi:hypothetical protein
VKHFLSFCVTDLDHTVRSNFDTLCFSLNATLQPHIIAQESVALGEDCRHSDAQIKSFIARYNSFKAQLSDAQSQDREANLSFRKSLTQLRASHRSRAISKFRNPPATNKTKAPNAEDLLSLLRGGESNTGKHNRNLAALLREFT